MRVLVPAAFLFAACAAPHAALVPATPATAAEFAAAGQLLTGFAPTDAAASWRTGDTVLYGLQLHEGTQQQRWLLQLTIVEPEVRQPRADGQGTEPLVLTMSGTGTVQGKPQPLLLLSKVMRVEVLVTDEQGHELERSVIQAPRDMLAKGFGPACRLMESDAAMALRQTGGGPEQIYAAIDVVPLFEAVSGLIALFEIVQKDKALSGILWEVVDKPSVFSVLWHLGVSASLQPRFLEAARAERPAHMPDSGPLWTVPMTLQVNGTPALECTVRVGCSLPPYALCGGTFALEASSPSDPGLRFSMTLLAAQRGAVDGGTRQR